MRAGDTIRGRWRVEGLAGRGASGEVYRGHDLVEGTTVAVKLLVRDELTAKARFEREIAILSALAVPGVVRYVGASDEPPALVMQWLDGETLKERLQRGALGVDATLRLARELASALAATHELGIVHRDLKPSNVFMAQDGESTRAVIIDFGIARRASEATLTQAGDTLGTPAYMAPEQVRGLAVDARADVYALGAVLYECVTGAPLVDARDVMSALAQILDAEPKTLAHVADAPPWLVGLVAAMVSHDAARRPADGRAVLAALDGEPGTAAIAGLSREETSVVSIVRMADALAAQETLSLSARASLPQQLLAIAREHDGQLTRQADGAWVVSFARSGSASDRAARAVACAGAMHAASGLSTAVATGRGLVTASGVLGEVVTRAQALTGSAVAIDVATQALLATRHGTRGEGPFVGRKSQLATLTTMLAEAGDERVTRSVLLVGEAGAGKSRLVRQLLTAWRGPVWSVRAEATRSAVPLALLGELVAAAKQAGNALDPVLEAARAADPMALARQREAAMKRLLHEASARDGLIVCIDDLQWADGSSLQLIAELLTEDAPLMWLLTCRTEAAERVNGELRVGVELRLPPLSLAAASELVSALMPDAEPELVAAITHKGAGHPLFLEELARSARAGLGTTPDTVRMMLQARLEQLHPTARRVLRAAAVFGRDFWLEGVAFVADLALEVVRQHLVALAREDLARPHATSRYQAEEATFRHDLVREAAEAMSTEGDKQRAHRLAAAWLTGREPRAATIAQHLVLGERPTEAAVMWALAAEQAHLAGDLGGVERCAAEARACGVEALDPTALARVEVAEAWSMLVRGDVAATALAAGKSFRHAAPGSDTWYLAAALTGSAAPYSGQLELARFVAEGLAAAWRDDVIDDRLVRAATPIVSGLIACGARHLAAPLVKRLFAIDIGEGVAGTWVLQARAFVEADRGDHAAAARYYLAASERLMRSGELASATAQLSNGADELMKCGAWRQAHEVMQRVDRTQLPGKLELVLDEFDGLALAHLGRLEEGVAIADNAFRVWNVPFIRGQILARFVAPLAPIDAPRALAVADEAVTALAPHALHLPSALATRSRVRRRVGDGDGARSDAEAAWAALIERASLRRPAIIRLAFIDELLARGETARAAALTLDARAALRTAAAQISDPALAQSFLDAVPEHAETMARAAVIDATTPGG